MAVLWYRSDRKNAVRLDRQADRDGDAELRRWNEMYARMHGTPVTDAPSGAEPVARDSSTGPEEARDVR